MFEAVSAKAYHFLTHLTNPNIAMTLQNQCISLLVLPAITLIINSCVPAESPPPQDTEVAAPFVEPQPMTGPIKVAIAIDLSGSIHANRIALPDDKQLQPIYDLLSEAGGELAVGLICDDSNQPLMRIQVDEPPRLKLESMTISSPPTPPDQSVNPFELVELQQMYLAQMEDYQQRAAAMKQQLAEQQQLLAQHQDRVEKELAISRQTIVPLLAQKATCQDTDLWGAVRRINTFLSEDDSHWSQPPKSYAIFVTDGLNTQQRSPIETTPQAEVLLVNGSGSVGIFSELPHKAFESFPAALNYVQSNFLQGGQTL